MDYLFLLVIIYMVLMLASSQIPPGSPVIDGPPFIVLNSQITLTCTSPRGDPPPTVTWFFDDTEITTGVSTTTAGTAVTTSLTFTATMDDHLEVVECQAENGVLQNPLSTTKYMEVHFSPESPVLTGPTTLTPGQQGIWTCVSANGYPAGVMSMRNKNKNTQFTTEFTSNSVLDKKSYDVTGTLTWSPVIVNNGDTICCDVTHTTTSTSPQTVCRQITASQPIAIYAPVTQYNPHLQSSVTLQCAVTQGIASQIIWIKDNVQLNIGTDSRLTGGTVATESLTITNVQQFDGGNYVCRGIDAVTGNIVHTDTINVNPVAVPTTNVEPRQYTATVGDTSFKIQCLVTSTSGATSWYWTFQPVGGSQQTIAQGTNDQQYTVDNSGTNPHLSVKSIALNEAGIYTCYATNAAGTSDSANNPSSRHTLTVTGGDLDITVSLTTYSAITGDSIVTILCKINGTDPAIAWDWTKTPIAGVDSEIISQGTNNARRQVINSATKPNLNIYSITEDDEGIYRCRANNGKQQYISEPIILKVQEASLRKVPGEPQTNNALQVEAGRTIMLTCSSTGGNPAPSVVWLKDSMLISTGSNSSIFGNVTTTTLTFVTTSYDNLEVYACQADNGFLQRPLVKTAYLLFSPSNKPPGQPIITGSQRYDLGDTVTLSCSSTGGNPLPTVNWLRDDNIITTGISRFADIGVTRTTLTFVAGLEDHLEVFECQAHNDYLQNPLASTTYIELYFAPRVPTLTGPSTLISGFSGKWTCSSANGYPAPTLSMRIQDRQYTNEITVVQSYNVIDKSYTVAGTLNLVPSTDKTGQDLCCDVTYLFDNNDPQSTCLQLTIKDEDEDNIIVYAVIGILATLVLFVLLVVMIRYRIGREKGKDNANSKYVSQQAAFSNQQDNADYSTHRDRVRDYEGLDSNRREMHVYNTPQDNEEYSTIPADHVFVDPNRTNLKRENTYLEPNHSSLKQDHTYMKPINTNFEPGHSILTPDNAYLKLGHDYFQPISGNSVTSTT